MLRVQFHIRLRVRCDALLADGCCCCCAGQAVGAVVRLLGVLDGWIDEIPPLPTPQRFGNLAFRAWGKRLETVRRLALLSGPDAR